MNKTRNLLSDAELVRKHLLNEAAPEEQQMLAKRIKECPALQEQINDLRRPGRAKEELNGLQAYSAPKAYQAFLKRAGGGKKRHIHLLPRYRKYVAAALIVLAVGVTAYRAFQASQGEKDAVIPPGISQAQLTLPDGRVLDVEQKDMEVETGGETIRYKKGILSYLPAKASSHPYTPEGRDEAPNEVKTPNGGENIVVLADGTSVCLNAGSRLVFPARFFGKQRIVRLEGEGYFKVTHDPEHPFIVKTPLGEITVLGTAFNVSAYPENNVCLTTLVHGKVHCKAPNGEELTLKPGEQAIVTEQGLTARAVDVEEYMGWTNGLYVFKNRALGDIMDTFSRWYNVDITFENDDLRHIPFSGNVKRYENLNTFLDALKLTEKVDFKIENGTIGICSPSEKKE